MSSLDFRTEHATTLSFSGAISDRNIRLGRPSSTRPPSCSCPKIQAIPPSVRYGVYQTTRDTATQCYDGIASTNTSTDPRGKRKLRFKGRFAVDARLRTGASTRNADAPTDRLSRTSEKLFEAVSTRSSSRLHCTSTECETERGEARRGGVKFVADARYQTIPSLADRGRQQNSQMHRRHLVLGCLPFPLFTGNWRKRGGRRAENPWRSSGKEATEGSVVCSSITSGRSLAR